MISGVHSTYCGLSLALIPFSRLGSKEAKEARNPKVAFLVALVMFLSVS